jgi:hypothetical protein
MYVTTHTVRLIEVQTKADELGKRMMECTYESELLYHSYCPDHVPTPITWVSYGEDPDPWFYLCDFYDMVTNRLSPSTFVEIIAEIHETSIGNHRSANTDFTYQLILLTYQMITQVKTRGRSGTQKSCKPCTASRRANTK